MSTINTGWTPELSADQKRENEIKSIKSILETQPNNEYWLTRLAALEDQNIDPAEVLASVLIGHASLLRPFGGVALPASEFTQEDERERMDLYTLGMGG